MLNWKDCLSVKLDIKIHFYFFVKNLNKIQHAINETQGKTKLFCNIHDQRLLFTKIQYW